MLKESMKENRQFWHNPVTVILAASLLFFSSQLIGALLALPFLRGIESESLGMFVVIFCSTTALFAIVSVARMVMGFQWRSFGILLPQYRYIWVLPIIFMCYLAVSTGIMLFVEQLMPGFDASEAQDIGFAKNKDTLTMVSAFVGLVILTPIFEEFIFRGVLFKGLRRRVPFWAAAIMAAAVFALAHGQWNVGLDTFVLGLVLCALVEKSGSIVPAILLHALKNGLAYVFLFVLS